MRQPYQAEDEEPAGRFSRCSSGGQGLRADKDQEGAKTEGLKYLPGQRQGGSVGSRQGRNQEMSQRVTAGESCMGTKNNVAVRVEERGALNQA